MVGACGGHGTDPKAVKLLNEGKVDLGSIVNMAWAAVLECAQEVPFEYP